jgi:hypothetical protein
MMALIVLFLAFLPQVPAPEPVEEPYTAIRIDDADVKAAAKVAFSIAKRKGTVLLAERHAVSGDNLRLCLAMNRSPSYEFARVVLSRDVKRKRWEVTVWTWGSCGR